MKKLLSLIVLSLFMMTGLAWAQGTLNFDEVDDNENKLWNLPAPNTYGSGSVEVNGITWEYGESQASDIYSIDNQGLLLRRASDSYLQAIIPNGIGTFSFQYRKGYTSGADRELELIVDGQQKATTGKFGNKASTDETDVYDFSCEVNKEGSVTIKIKNIGATNTNRHAVIDNIVWTAYGTGTQDPSLIVSPSNLSGFCYTEGTGSSPIKNFNVSGMYLTENISIEVGDNFEISLSPEDGYTNELTLEHIDGQVTNTAIYVRMPAGLGGGAKQGTITVNSSGLDEETVVLTGVVYGLPPEDCYFVNFEGKDETMVSYQYDDPDDNIVELSGIEWVMTEALIGTSTVPISREWVRKV